MSSFALSRGWLLLLLPLWASSASAGMLFQVVNASGTTPTDHYTTTCRISSTGTVVIDHQIYLWDSRDTLRSIESKTVKLSVSSLRRAIDQLALGNISGEEKVGGGAQAYYAYQLQKDGSNKDILILDQQGGLRNDSPLVTPLKKFIDGVCGQITTH